MEGQIIQETRATLFLKEAKVGELEVEERLGWMMDMIKFIERGEFPQNAQEAKQTKRLAPNYVVHGNALYKRGHVHLSQQCLGPSKAKKVLEDIYVGYCRSHIGGKALAHTILHQGYYWRLLKKDAQEFV